MKSSVFSRKQQSQPETQASTFRQQYLNNQQQQQQISSQTHREQTNIQKHSAVNSPQSSSNSQNSHKSNSQLQNQLSPRTAANKQFQPILRKNNEPQSRVNIVQKDRKGNIVQEKKQSKSSGKQQQNAVLKEPFVYEEKKADKKKSNKAQSKGRVQSIDAEFQVHRYRGDALDDNIEDQMMIEVKQDNVGQDVQDSIQMEDRIRPSDEVQYQEYSDSNHRSSSINANNKFNDLKGTKSSFKVIEEFKNDTKNHFDPIQEEEKDDQFLRELNRRENSDFKKYNFNHDNFNNNPQHQQSLKKHYENTSKQLNINNFNNQQLILDTYSEITHHTEHNLQETPRDIKEKTRNVIKDLNEDSQTHSMMGMQGKDEKSLRGTNTFIENNNSNCDTGVLSPQSFGSPQQQKKLKQVFNEPVYLNNQAHILSFSDQNQYHMEYPTVGNVQEEPDSKKMTAASLKNELTQPLDFEKNNYIIQQYETVLQQLNVEFHKLLSKQKETEEQLSQKEQLLITQQQVIQEKEHVQFQLESANRQLNAQVQDLIQEVEIVSAQVKRQQAQEYNDSWRYERDILDQKIQNLQNKVQMHTQNETDLKDQLENCLQKLRASEQRLRSKDEEMFQMSRDNQALSRDLKNIRDIEQILKNEIQQAQQQRITFEESVQEMKQKVCQLQIQIRQRESELENVVRENRNVKGTLDSITANYNEVISENNRLKEQITDVERSKMQMRNMVELKDRENKGMMSEIKKLQMQMEQERHSSQSMEAHYKNELQKMMSLMRERQEQKRQDMINDAHNRSYQEEWMTRNNRGGDNNIEFQKEQFIQGFYSPQRNARNHFSTNDLDQNSPRQENQQKNINWVYGIGQRQVNTNNPNNNNKKINSEFDRFNKNTPQPNQQSDTEGSLKRRNNANDSQLGEVFSWNQNKSNFNQTQQYPPPKTNRSLERIDNNMQRQNMKPAAVEVQQQNWQQLQKSPIPSHSKNQLMDDHLQAAGKKSTVLQSPFNKKNSEQQITHLQNSLSAMQIDKERVRLQISVKIFSLD